MSRQGVEQLLACCTDGNLRFRAGIDFDKPKGIRVVEITNTSSDVREDWPTGSAPVLDDDDWRGKGEERCEEAFEATILRLDRDASDMLLRFAD